MACARALAGFSVVQESEGKDETAGSRAGAVEEAQGQNPDQVRGLTGLLPGAWDPGPFWPPDIMQVLVAGWALGEK